MTLASLMQGNVLEVHPTAAPQPPTALAGTPPVGGVLLALTTPGNEKRKNLHLSLYE